MTGMQALLAPESIAVVGASPRGNRGLQILQNLRRFNTSARVYPVHPREPEVLGWQAYPDLAALPEVPEFVAVAVDADRSLPVLAQAIELGSAAGLILASGFGEGGSGEARRAALAEILDGSDFLLCGPNCYGVLNAASGFAGYSGQVVEPFAAGRTAVVMQSGALTHSLTDSAVGRELALSHLITTGNEMSVTLGRYVAALADDPAVDVIGVFIEGLRDPAVFADAARTARERGKPVVALTVGRSELGQRAAMAHTGAVSGGGEAMAGFLRSCGVVQTGDLDEFRETLIAFGAERRPVNDGVALISISGGGTGLLSDLSETVGLRLPELAAESIKALDELLPDYGTASNPLDVTGSAVEDPTLMERAIEVLQADPAIGTVALALNVPGGSLGQEELYRKQVQLLAERGAASDVPLVAMSLTAGPVDPEIAASASDARIPLLVGARPGLQALAGWTGWHAAQHDRVAQPRSSSTPTVELGAGPTVAGSRALDLIASAGVAVPAYATAADVESAEALWPSLTPPVVLKIESDAIAHKTDVGGVALGIGDREALQSAAARMLIDVQAAAPTVAASDLSFLLQEQVDVPSVECLVGIVRDPQVGLVVSVSPGGVLAELVGAVRSTPVPATRSDVEHLIDSSPLAALLSGYRGAPRADRAALVELVLAFADLAASCGPRLAAAELNPVLVLPEGSGAVAVDALFITEEDQ
jgi:acyl-CoA synthetase (NDP forming)